MRRQPPTAHTRACAVDFTIVPEVVDRPVADEAVDEQFAALWAARQAAAADFGDSRLNTRMAKVLSDFRQRPTDAIPQASGGDKSQAKATYRFLSNKRVTFAKIIWPIAVATAQECSGRPTIFVVQDTTSFNYSGLHQTTGLGRLSGPASSCQGLHLHSTLALAPDGTPLGLLHAHWWARPLQKPKKKKGTKGRKKRKKGEKAKPPFEQRESYKWVRGIHGARSAFDKTLDPSCRPRLVHVCDRESDIHEVLQEIARCGDGAIIRCDKDRNIAEPLGKAHAAVQAAPLLGTHRVELPATPKRAKRTAQLELRAVKVTLQPDTVRQPHREPLACTLVEAKEVDAPPGEEPVIWRLWTFDEVTTLEQAIAIVKGYCLRWRVEEYHLTLKSGCKVEELQLETAARLANAIALYGPVAVQIVALRDLGRRCPDAPCTQVLADSQWRVLWRHCAKSAPAADQAPPTVRQAVLWIGKLGGHLGRKSDGMPGVRTLWRGMRDLTLLVAGYEAAHR